MRANRSRQFYRSDLKHGHLQILGKEEVLNALDDDLAVLKSLDSRAISRSFPHRRFLTAAAADTLRRTLLERSIPLDLKDEGVELCYQLGWLQAEALDREANDVVCSFPSRIHEK